MIAREGARIAYQFLDTQFAEDAPTKTAALDQPLPAAAGEADSVVTDSVVTDTVVTGTIAIPTRRPDRKG